MDLRLDHLVLTCADVEATVAFYERVLGFRREVRDGRTTLHFGRQKINLHQKGREIEPHALLPTPGSADLCFVGDQTPDWWLEHLLTAGVVILEGPVERNGALGPMTSVYFRDPDGNLLEVAHYGKAQEGSAG